MMDKRLTAGLHLIANGVFVVSAQYKGHVRGFTATWVSQISFEHPLLMASISKTHDTYALIASANKFFVNILGVSQVDVARHFGKAKAGGENDMEYFREEQGQISPILKDAMAVLECNVVSTHDVRDHTIFVGEVTNSQVFHEEAPLVYWRRKKYGKAQPLEETPGL